MNTLRDHPEVAAFLHRLRQTYENVPFVVRTLTEELVGYPAIAPDVLESGTAISLPTACELALEHCSEDELMRLAREIVNHLPQAKQWLGDYFYEPLNAESFCMLGCDDASALILELPWLQDAQPIAYDGVTLDELSRWVVTWLLKPQMEAMLRQPFPGGLSGAGLFYQRQSVLYQARWANQQPTPA